MATSAALACLDERVRPDALWFASTSSPYLEKQAASILAGAVDAPREAFTVDVGGSLRGWTSALRSAADALIAGMVSTALIAGGDVRPAAPESAEELSFGDGGGAAVLEREGEGARLLAAASVNDNTLAMWRRAGDRFVQTGDLRFAFQAGIVDPAVEAATRALESAGVVPQEVRHLAVAAADPRAGAVLQKALGLENAEPVQLPLQEIGYTGVALPALLLAQSLARAEPGEPVLLVASGDGADALVFRAEARPLGVERVEALIADGRELPSYDIYLRRRGILAREATAPPSSTVAQRREEGQYLRFHGARCRSCGHLQYPVTPLCERCGQGDLEEVRLSRHGTVYTYTSDHIVAGVNPGLGESPVTMAVVDLDDGARVFLQLADAAQEEIQVGLDVEVCFRLLHEGSGYHNYYWKARPRTSVSRE